MGHYPDSTVSAHLAQKRLQGSKVAAGVCHVLNVLDYRDAQAPEGDHCDIALKHDLEGKNE
jgi:hypothetical protein